MSLGAAYVDLTNPSQYKAFEKTLGVSGGNPGRPLARRLNVGQGALALNQLGFRSGLESQRQSSILRLLQNLSPGNKSSLSTRNRNRVFENAAKGGGLLNSLLQGQGYGTGARLGAQAGLTGQAISEANRYDQYLDSPEYEDAAMNAVIRAIMGGTDQDLVQGLYGGSGQIQQSNMMKDQSEDLFGSILGQGLGMAIGGGWNPFGKAKK